MSIFIGIALFAVGGSFGYSLALRETNKSWLPILDRLTTLLEKIQEKS